VKKGQITFVVFHILGSSIASLNEIEDTSSFTEADSEPGEHHCTRCPPGSSHIHLS
jgi:hypothetical protein